MGALASAFGVSVALGLGGLVPLLFVGLLASLTTTLREYRGASLATADAEPRRT